MLELYTNKLSYDKSENIKIYINNSNNSIDNNVKISIIDINNKILHVSNCIAIKQNSNVNCFAEGCDWEVNKIINIDFKLEDNLPNIYFIKITNSNDELTYHPFIIKRNLYKKAVICNTNTWNAYNGYGGVSFYKNNLSGYKSKYLEINDNNQNGSLVASFTRPFYFTESIHNIINNNKMGREHLIYGESILWKFLQKNNYNFDLIIDSDVENINNIINRNIIFLNCHPGHTKCFII